MTGNADPQGTPTSAVVSLAQPANVNGTQPPDRVPFAVLTRRTDVPDPSATTEPATMYPDRCPRCYTTSRDWVRHPFRVTDDTPGFVRADYRCDRHIYGEEWSCWWARQTATP